MLFITDVIHIDKLIHDHNRVRIAQIDHITLCSNFIQFQLDALQRTPIVIVNGSPAEANWESGLT